MNQFSATKREEATVPFPRSRVWEALVDPDLVARLTPMVKSISTSPDDAETWIWHLRTIPVVGVAIEPHFTVKMTFTPEEHISYSPVPGQKENTCVTGEYGLTATGESSTHLSIHLTITVALPLPKMSRRVVHPVMQATLATMGVGFARALDRELRHTS